MEVKSAFKIGDDLKVEDDGFELQFTSEEMQIIEDLAKKRGISKEELIREMTDKAVNEANAKVADIMLKKLEQYQNEAKRRESKKRV